MRTRQMFLVTLAACGLLGAAAACTSTGGEASKPPAEILRDAQTAARSADSVHIAGTVVRGGDTATIDLVLTAAGDGREQITGPGQSIDLIKVGSTLYVKGLTAPGAGAGYQRLAVDDPRASPLIAQLNKDAVFAQLIKDGDTPKVTGTDTVAGQSAVALTPGTGAGVLYVADDADHPYPLKVATSAQAGTPAGPTAAGPTGTLTFSEWNQHAVIRPPSGS